MILLLNVNSKAVNAISKWCTWYTCMLIVNVNTCIWLFPSEVFQFQFRAEDVRKSLLFYSGTVLLSSRISVRWSVEILLNDIASWFWVWTPAAVYLIASSAYGSNSKPYDVLSSWKFKTYEEAISGMVMSWIFCNQSGLPCSQCCRIRYMVTATHLTLVLARIHRSCSSLINQDDNTVSHLTKSSEVFIRILV